ncbi:MAG TPA: YncE family protein [Stellaceae bacterium]|nr:YncE family protein [Stellaceae bacterium]
MRVTLALARPARRLCRIAVIVAAVLGPTAIAAEAQLMIVGNDEKITWDENGKAVNRPPGKDTIDIFDLKGTPASPKLLATLDLENSIVGPPVNLAITPDDAIAIIANSLDSVKDGEGWKTVPDNKLYVVDLTTNPPQRIATIEVGKQPSGVAISRKGDLALVANRADNSISVLAIEGKEVKVIDTVPMGDSVAAVAITPDGKHALAVKPTVNRVALLDIDGQKVTYGKYDMIVGNFPYNVAIAPGGKIALVNNNGANGSADGNVDTDAVIDLEASPPRVIDFVVVGDGPEGLAISPKGNLAASLLLRGSNADHKAFFYHKNSAIAVLRISGKKVTKVSEVEVGGLAEGIGFSPDGKYLYVGNFLDGDMSILKVDGTKLVETGKRMKLSGHPASLRVSPR